MAVHIKVSAKLNERPSVLISFEEYRAIDVHSMVAGLLRQKRQDHSFALIRSSDWTLSITLGIDSDKPVLDVKGSILHPILNIVAAAMMRLGMVEKRSEAAEWIWLTWSNSPHHGPEMRDLVREFFATGDSPAA